MNTWMEKDGFISPGGRGFYVEGREDHLVTAFFEDFSLFPDFGWFEHLLDLLGIQHEGRVRAVRWAYSYEEVLAGEKRPRIADVTVMWADSGGAAVLVIEAKRPKFGRNGVKEKDLPATKYYLRYAAMASLTRRYQALLVDQQDVGRLQLMADASGLITWQQLCDLKTASIEQLQLPASVKKELCDRVRWHHAELGLMEGPNRSVGAHGRTESYERWRSMEVPLSVRHWLVGSELFFSTRHRDTQVDIPYVWLADEMSAADWRREKKQTTKDRQNPIWILPS